MLAVGGMSEHCASLTEVSFGGAGLMHNSCTLVTTGGKPCLTVADAALYPSIGPLQLKVSLCSPPAPPLPPKLSSQPPEATTIAFESRMPVYSVPPLPPTLGSHVPAGSLHCPCIEST
jgi:hypothetical protein